MKIALPYYRTDTFRDVSDDALRVWTEVFIFSNTPFQPCLVTDGSVTPPEWWSYDVLELDVTDWPERTHAAQLCDLLVTAAVREIGHVLALDLDTLILRSLSDASMIDSRFAMAADFGQCRYDPGQIVKRSAGVMILKDATIFDQLCREWETPHAQEWLAHERMRSFASELMLSKLHAEYGGHVLPSMWNVRWSDPAAWQRSDTRIVHFVGDGKSHYLDFGRGVVAGRMG